MLIVDAQVHIWSAGPPTNPSHRQVTSYTAEECIRDMDAAGVNACLLAPAGLGSELGQDLRRGGGQVSEPLRDPRQLPARQAGKPIADRQLEEPARYARATLRVHSAAPGQLDDRRHDGLAMAGCRARRDPDCTDGVELSAAGRADRRAAPRLEIAASTITPASATARTTPHTATRRPCWHWRSTRTWRSSAPARPAIRASPIPIATFTNTHSRSSRPSGRSAASGAPT